MKIAKAIVIDSDNIHLSHLASRLACSSCARERKALGSARAFDYLGAGKREESCFRAGECPNLLCVAQTTVKPRGKPPR